MHEYVPVRSERFAWNWDISLLGRFKQCQRLTYYVTPRRMFATLHIACVENSPYLGRSCKADKVH